MSSPEHDRDTEEHASPIVSHTKLNDPLVQQIRELNKKLLLAEQEKEKLKSEIASIKSLFCQEMRIKNPENMGISEMKARFRGYRRREEEMEEARLVEHNRNVSELFATVRQNMKVYEKRVSDAVNAIVARARNEDVLSEETFATIENQLEILTKQRENSIKSNEQLLSHDRDLRFHELTEENSELRDRIAILESIQNAIRNGSQQGDSVEICSLREELNQKTEQIKQLSSRISTLDADLAESERIRKQQHQQLLLMTDVPPSNSDSTDNEMLRAQVERLRADQKQAAIEIASLKNRNQSYQSHVSELEEQLSVLQQRYEASHKEWEELHGKYEENEKVATTIMTMLKENDDHHKEEIEKVIQACQSESKSETLKDVLKELNYYSRQKEFNVMTVAYQKMEEYLMNRIRQLTNLINRNYTLISESLDIRGQATIPEGMVSEVTKGELMEMKRVIPVVNMNYLKEVIVKFISFPRGSSERTFLYPVMKTLLSLGEREMRIMKGDMSYKPASRIPIDRPLVKDNRYIDSASLLNVFKNTQ